jgi:translation initiation factor 3 subunit A
LLRQHLATAVKYAHQAHGIDLNDPETLQRHLDTRFVQLNVATKLELWQEAFRTTEDIHHLLSASTRPPKPFMMANYYENLARTFMVGENYLFHAAAWSKYYETVRMNKNLSDEEHSKIASLVLISALAIPVAPSADSYRGRDHRLTALLREDEPPTRAQLLKNAVSFYPFSS